jgi:hypothetical protein
MNKFFIAIIAATVHAQDPADGWMAYAVGAVPAGTERITRLEMTWNVGANAKISTAFYSPWFGMDPADNLNLIQPVNPWSGSAWSMYTEYYQWSPTHNSNSKSFPVTSGQTLHGSLLYDAGTDSYTLSQTIMQTGTTSSQIVKCQNGKKFTIPYVVYEKVFPCKYYPPDQIVSFTNIIAECDGVDCTDDIVWTAAVKDPNCDMQAVIVNQHNISITWSTLAESKYDNMTDAELFKLNYHGWATKLNLDAPLA